MEDHVSCIEVSIIIPVYNVEKYLRRCLESIINQSLKNIEIIIVNDGSTDRSIEICNEYADLDKRVRVFNKENGGLSDARNYGLINAKGLYVLFVDSDDFINTDSLEKLYLCAIINNLEIVVGDATRVEEHKVYQISHSDSVLEQTFTGSEFLKHQLKYNLMNMAVWLNLYNRDFLITNQFFFKKGIYHEDELWTPIVFLKAQRVRYEREAFYQYIIRKDSITKQKDRTKNGVDLINTCKELEVYYKSVTDKKLRNLLLDYLTMLFLHAIHFGNLYYHENKEKLYTKKFLIGKPRKVKNIIKSAIFILNEKFYKRLHSLFE